MNHVTFREAIAITRPGRRTTQWNQHSGSRAHCIAIPPTRTSTLERNASFLRRRSLTISLPFSHSLYLFPEISRVLCGSLRAPCAQWHGATPTGGPLRRRSAAQCCRRRALAHEVASRTGSRRHALGHLGAGRQPETAEASWISDN